MQSTLYASLLSLLLFSCQPTDTTPGQTAASAISLGAFPVANVVDVLVEDTLDYDTTQWMELTDLDSSILLDIRYATANNFVKEILYDCPRCFLRPKAAAAVIAAHRALKTTGFALKMFDCYRPRSVQWKLWEIFPQPNYVADPRTGSIHNRGGAVDLTIVDHTGKQLDMGTIYDFFGPKAHHTYTDFPKEVLANRQMLKNLMKKHGFSPIRSEWWHYNYKGESYELADEMWKCD